MSETEASRSVESREPETPKLIDIEFPGSLGKLGFMSVSAAVMLVVIVCALPCCVLISVGGAPLGMLVWLAALVLGCVGYLASARQARLRVEEAIARSTMPDAAKIARDIVRHAGDFVRRDAVKAMARALPGEGRTGLAIRIGPSDCLSAIEPIADSFEIRPLKEGDPTFIELAGATGDSADRLKATRVRKRALAWLVLIAIGAACISFFVLAWPRIRSRMLLTIPLYAALSFGLYAMGWSAPMLEWYVVPGGIVLRKRFGPYRKQQLRLYSRASSVVVIFLRRMEHWGVFASDGTTLDEGRFTSAEVALLLRAWLSPAAPPTREQIEALL